MKIIKFRLRNDSTIVGYEKWYVGSFGEVLSANPCWLYSKDGEYWGPDYIYHKQKDQFIGITDNTGKEIFEHDVVTSEDIKEKYIVEHDERGIRFIFATMKGWEWQDWEEKKLKVVGNVFSNKRILQDEGKIVES